MAKELRRGMKVRKAIPLKRIPIEEPDLNLDFKDLRKSKLTVGDFKKRLGIA